MHNRLLARLVLSIAAISLCSARSAHAQSAEAEAMFNEGDRLMAAGQIAQACDAFEASNKIEPRAGTLIRLGECREANKQIASAWSAYKDALTRAKDPRKLEVARAKAAELEPKLSYLTVLVGDNKVDGLAITRNGKPVDALLWNRALPVDGGDYVVLANAPDYRAWQTTVTVAPERATISVAVPKLEPIPKPMTPTGIGPTVPTETPKVIEPAKPSMFTTKRKIAVGLGGAAAVGVIAGVVLGTQASGKQNDAHLLCPDPNIGCANADRAQELNDSARGLALGANIAFGVAAAAAIGAGVLWFTGAPESPRKVAIVPSAGPGSAGVFVFGRF